MRYVYIKALESRVWNVGKFIKGQVYHIAEDIAKKIISRGHAELVTEIKEVENKLQMEAILKLEQEAKIEKARIEEELKLKQEEIDQKEEASLEIRQTDLANEEEELRQNSKEKKNKKGGSK